MSPTEAEEAAELLDILREMREWSMSGRRWREVEAALDIAIRALADGDVESLSESVKTVESADPTRMLPLGEEGDEGTMTEPVRERAEVLRDRISDMLAQPADDDDR
ncbi:hypothetical protein ETD83_02415 [Actinomadura soli]|uniref:CATRA-Associated Small Protein domain-containing protein n=1 Tax=Actinomadura soli TaxID=2508997 RepID=A0A5C4JK14_9ACTN|nr:CATRA system-associated protein [Actinomadura soli]TMR07013.1 hypothetical protein ETD83_02415 [Actinomadura soli]